MIPVIDLSIKLLPFYFAFYITTCFLSKLLDSLNESINSKNNESKHKSVLKNKKIRNITITYFIIIPFLLFYNSYMMGFDEYTLYILGISVLITSIIFIFIPFTEVFIKWIKKKTNRQ